MSETFKGRKQIIENQEKINEQILKLQELDRTKNEFMTMITHELKNPLVPILCYTDILLQEKFGHLNEYQRRRLEIVKSSAEMLKKITVELLDVQKMEFGNLKLENTTCNMTQIVQYVIESFQPDAVSKRIKITSELKKNVSCFCDEARMIQVLSNVISNAIDFCPSKNGKIRLYLDSNANWITISIEDNGIGIPKEKIGKVFEKFYQADTSIIRKHGGTGIGLSFCKGVIGNHNGKISIESELGHGCQVHIKLPVRNKTILG
jgi:signal transduction histidine kinase